MLGRMWREFLGYSLKAKIAVCFFPALILIGGIADSGLFDSAEVKAEKKKFASYCFKDGKNSDINYEISKRLRDPKSFEHISTTSSAVENGSNVVKVSFRAKNGFGGYTQSSAVVTINNFTCHMEGEPVILE